MHSNALQDLDAIDAAMASVGTGEFLGIDVSPTRLGTHARMSNAMKKRQKHEPISSEVSGMIEPFESRMLPSTLLHPLTDSSFSMTLKSGATMSDGILQTNGGISEIADNDTLDFGTGDFTISASVQFQRNNEIEMILFKIARGANTQGYGLRKMNDNSIQGLLFDGNGNFLALNSIGKITDTTGFHDISMVRKDGILELWIDGQNQQTTISEGAQGNYDITNSAPMIIGRTDGGHYQLEAKIKTLLMTKGAFTPTEMAELQKVQDSPLVSQETANVIAEKVAEQQKVQMQTETYIERQMLSFSDLPNGTYSKGDNFFTLKDGTKIRVFNDEASIVISNGTIQAQKSNGEASWIWIGFQDDVPRKVSNLDIRYDPTSGGSAQPRISYGSNDANHKIVPLTNGGMFPINQLMRRAIIETFEHRGTGIAGIEVEVEKTREVPIVSQEPEVTVASLSKETQSAKQATVSRIETYTEPEFISFANVPDGTYARGNFHIVNLTSDIKIRLYSDDDFVINGGVITPKIGSGNDWIHVSLADGQSPIPVSSVRVRYNPNGGIAQGMLHVLSEDDTNRVIKISEQGDIPVQGPIKRVLMTLERHEGALLGMTLDVTKTREIIVPVAEEPAESVEGISEETLTTIAEVIASQEAESVIRPEASETIEEHAPLLRVVGIQGSNITLAASSPMTGGNSVRFTNLQDDGLFTGSVIQGVTDGSVTPVSLGMNAANGTGNYRIVLAGGPNGSTLASVEVHWDRDSKKLSLAGSEKLWECSEQIGKVMNAQTQEVLALAKNPMVGSGVLQAMQQESLIDGVRALPSSGISIPEFESAFWNAHPEWKDDAIHETAVRESQRTGYTATQIYNRIVTQRNDTLSILRDAYGRYISHMGDLLQEGVRVLSAVRNGENEPDIRRNFAILVDQISTNLTMFKLSDISIRIPDGNTLLEAVKSVWTTRCGELIKISSETARLQAADVYQAGLVTKGFVELSDGQKVASDDPRASTKLVFFLDEMNRPTLKPQGEVALQGGIETYAIQKSDGQNQIVANTEFKWIGNGYDLIKESEIPTSKNTLIVVIYGSNQLPGDQISGFDTLVKNLQNDYEHIVSFTPGKNPSAAGEDRLLPDPDAAMESMKLQLKESFAGNPLLSNVVLVGYSWGGGAVYELSKWISENKQAFNITISATVYVDAVTNPAASGGSVLESASAENRLPIGTQAMLNIYQSDTGLISDKTINGGPIYNPSILVQEIDFDALSDQFTHETMDEASVWTILDFIRARIHSKKDLISTQQV